ncbi:hypothetical protein F443_09131 [Phytophthora nicotianae P1569]|uniref:Uncharacterized protein n=1 Tax=Phytophthora nicotianae P1569 TaxID=1317065 RepID=V9F5X3_PHYNI|nr:hypothetical protein F443_09131 [Phytophthora nicotianae P1569]
MLSINVDHELMLVYEKEMEQRRRRHSANMVIFRRNKKAKQKALEVERRRLEEIMKQLEANMRNAAAVCSTEENYQSQSSMDTLRELVVEIEGLRNQNIALRKQVGLYAKFQQVLMEARQPKSDDLILPIAVKSGWRVYFPNDEPSFHFYPFTQTDFNDVMDSSFTELSTNPPDVSLAGEFMGWNVHQATVSSNAGDHSLVARARFTKHVRCSLQEAYWIMSKEEKDSWPVIVTPLNWGGAAQRGFSSVVLQQFNENSCVLVRNITGNDEVNLRYICLSQRSRYTERGGKRVITYTMVITDSESNKRSRSTETNLDKVEWVTEGGANLTLTETHDDTVAVVYDHWGGCQGSLHAKYLFVQWAHYALRWEQMVTSRRLLNFEQ